MTTPDKSHALIFTTRDPYTTGLVIGPDGIEETLTLDATEDAAAWEANADHELALAGYRRAEPWQPHTTRLERIREDHSA